MNFQSPNTKHEFIRCKKCKRRLVGDFDGKFQHMMRYHAAHMISRIPALLCDPRLPQMISGLVVQFVQAWELWQ